MAKGSMNPGDYKSMKCAGAKRKRVTMGDKDPACKAAMQPQHNMKGMRKT